MMSVMCDEACAMLRMVATTTLSVAAPSRVAACFRRGVRALGGVIGILRDGARRFFHVRRRLFEQCCLRLHAFRQIDNALRVSLAPSAIAMLDD
ncbi:MULTISPECIES: hypothetical protein [unclassified Caballeronia]|uniref:hypothetical protein n=1 Tax=unclassified Caballeronia TaxID=2646786 RepID=UPI002027893D|nr:MULTISPECIES: hypothetical protein [unclassified Caballeronia]